MGAQARNHDVFVSFVQLFLHFFQREVHDVMMVNFLRSQGIAEAQPQPVQKINFVGGQIGRVRPEDFVDFVPVGHVNFEIELRPLVAELFPGVADEAGLLFGALVRGVAEDDGAGLERSGRAKNAIGEIVGGDDGKACEKSCCSMLPKSCSASSSYSPEEERRRRRTWRTMTSRRPGLTRSRTLPR